MRGGALFKGKEGRGDFRKNSTKGGYIPNPYGRDLGLGYRVRTPSSQRGAGESKKNNIIYYNE